MRVWLVLGLLLAGGLAGCAHPAPTPSVRTPESFQAVYSYDVPFGNRQGTVNVSLDGPVAYLDRDLVQHQGYRFSFEAPNLLDVPGKPAHPTKIVDILDDHLRRVRVDSCPDREDGKPCKQRFLSFDAGPTPAPLGYGLPLQVAAGSAQRRDHADGSLDILGYHYAPGRLLPTNGTDLQGYVLISYTAGAPLAAIAARPPIPIPAANATYPFRLFPEEKDDVLEAGWTVAQALDHLAADDQAGPILRDGGCIRGLWLMALRDRTPTQTLLHRDAGSVEVFLEGKDRASTLWSFGTSGTPPTADGFEPVQKQDGLPFLYEAPCSALTHGPPPMPFHSFQAALEPWVPWRDRSVMLGISRQASQPNGCDCFTPRNLGFEYSLYTFPSYTTTDFLPGPLATHPSDNVTAGGWLDAWTGTLGGLFVPPGNDPP